MQTDADLNFLEISGLLSGECQELSFERKWALSLEEGGVRTEEVSFSGKMKNLAGDLSLSGTVQSTLVSECARCLAPVSEKLQFEIEVPVVTGETENEDAVPAKGEKVDLLAVAEENLLMRWPMRLLCREDCAGICPKCGQNLNESTCSCDKKEIDPRLEGLADFFK